MIKLSLIFLSFLISVSSYAIVDMKNANFSNTWIDLDLPGTGYDLKISRTYNSRSLFNGMFGFGWCSDFETTIEVTAEGNLKLTECGAGQELLFSPRELAKKDIDKTVKSIVAKLKAEKKLDDRSIKILADKMATDSDLRSKYAINYKLSIPVKEGTQFLANGREVENIVFGKGYYTRNMPDGSSMRFSSSGRLTHMYDKNGNFLKFEYSKDNTVKEASDNNGRKLSFKYFNNKKVKSITGPSGLSVSYKFTNLDDLTYVKNSWTNVYTYEYDDLHNVTKVVWPDKTFVVIAYDKKRDWVVGFTDRDQCNETYKYEFSDNDPKNHYWSTVKKVCGKEVVNESRHEFWYTQRADGETFLQRVASNVNGNVTDISYHEVYGKPVSIQRNSDVYKFEYFSNGLVKVKTGPNTKLVFDYDSKVKKVSRVITSTMNPKGKVVSTKKTDFRYDKKGNLTYAQNSDGQKINMTYDNKGRIATITDQAKKLVKIQYEERFGKPALVTRPGLGTIKVTYKSGGEIDKVNSAEGPSVAMQVASTFNNLLDIISPATAEVFN
jgi:YD repeat-containing protein